MFPFSKPGHVFAVIVRNPPPDINAHYVHVRYTEGRAFVTPLCLNKGSYVMYIYIGSRGGGGTPLGLSKGSYTDERHQ